MLASHLCDLEILQRLLLASSQLCYLWCSISAFESRHLSTIRVVSRYCSRPWLDEDMCNYLLHSIILMYLLKI